MEGGPIVITLSVCPSVCKSTNPMLYDKFNLHRRNHLNFLPIVRIDERRLRVDFDELDMSFNLRCLWCLAGPILTYQYINFYVYIGLLIVLDVSFQLKRKPGQSDVDRTLGSVEQKYRKLKTTDTPAAESQVSLAMGPINIILYKSVIMNFL